MSGPSANPYTTQAIVSYNPSPPADDGSAVAANQVYYSTIKTKITDPVKTLAEAINTAMVTAGAKGFNSTASVANNVESSLGFTPSTLTPTDASPSVITPTGTYHLVDTFAAAASDNLDTAATTNVATNALLILSAANTARTVIVKHANGAAGSFHMRDNADYTLDDDVKSIVFQRRSGDWYEITRSAAGASTAVVNPQGRLSLTTAVPVGIADVTAAASIFYVPYIGNQCPIYDGTLFQLKTFTERTLTLANPAHAINSNFDIFAALDPADGTTFIIGTGPAWTSDTGRGTGAGTTELVRILGRLVNNVAITLTNGATTYAVAINQATYLGTFRTTGTVAQTEMTMNPAAATGGSNNHLYLWNMYNRVDVVAICRDDTNTWSYTTGTIRSANNNVANRISYVSGIAEDTWDAEYSISVLLNAGQGWAGIGYDATNSMSGMMVTSQNADATNERMTIRGRHTTTSLGLHFMQATERGDGGTTVVWAGDDNIPTYNQMALILRGRM